MTYSVLHLKSLENDKYCGVWCSDSNSWVFKGTYDECFVWKHQRETEEQEIDNSIYHAALKKKQNLMFTPLETILNKYYVYSLSYNNKVFYIGVTKDLKTRYLGHINCCDTQTRGFILNLRLKNELPDIRIIYSIDNESEAKKIERRTIQDYINNEHKLCNLAYNIPENRIIIEYCESTKCQLPLPNKIRDASEHIEKAIKEYCGID